jgi:hypothetical protein
MKHSKIFRILSMTVILSLLVMALPVSSALAASEDIELDPDEGEIGDEIEVNGEDFEESDEGASEYVYVTVYFSDEEADEGNDIDDDVENYEIVDSSATVDEDGEWDTSFDVPDELTDGEDDVDVTGGTYYVYVTYKNDEEIVAVAEFTVMAAELELDPDEGPVGTEVDISGVDFADYEDITIEFDGDDIDIESGDDATDKYGDFDCTVIIPEAVAGEHTITVTDDSGIEAEAEFTVEPEIEISPDKASPGDSVTVSGTGFGEEVDFTIELDDDEVVSDETDDDGSFQVSFTVPVKSAGTYDVEASDDDKNKDTVNLTVVAGAQLSQTTGNVGDTFTISGKGFTPNSSVTITLGNKQTTASTDADGKFSASATVPGGQNGAQTVTASDGTNTVTATFTVESTAPPAPTPLLPLDGDKAKSQAQFDWEDVNDPSLPVTYNLQIATDESFSVVVVQKLGLTSSEYTLTGEEKLSSTTQDAPYYWRVQAVDGANNKSSWITPGAFYVGFSFGSISWPLYILIGIAILIVILVVYLMVLRAGRH